MSTLNLCCCNLTMSTPPEDKMPTQKSIRHKNHERSHISICLEAPDNISSKDNVKI